MQFVRNNDVYKVARIAGPEHNILGIRLAGNASEIAVVELPMKGGERRRLDRHAVVFQVEQGLAQATLELGKAYSISAIFYVPSDSPSSSVYRYLVIEFIKRIDGGGPFSS